MAWFVNSANPWFKRGHAFHGGTGAGVFAFNHNAGNANTNNGFRVRLYYDFKNFK